MPAPFCALLRTKTAYYRTPDGERIFKPERPRVTPASRRSGRSDLTGGPSMRKLAARIADVSNRNKTATPAMTRKIAATVVIVAFFAAAFVRPSSVLARLNGLIVYGDGFMFTVTEPEKWTGDTQSAARWGANRIFYKQGDLPTNPGTVVIRIGIFNKADENTSKDLEADMNEYRSKYPGVEFKDLDGIKTRYRAWPKLFYVPKTFYEYVTYLNPGSEHRQLASISMNKTKTAATADELHAYEAIVQSFVLTETNVIEEDRRR